MLAKLCFSVENDTYTWILFACMYFTAFLLAVSQRVFMYILTLHCIFIAHIYSRILAFWQMLSVIKTSCLVLSCLISSYLISPYLISSHLISHLISSHLIFISSHLISPHLTSMKSWPQYITNLMAMRLKIYAKFRPSGISEYNHRICPFLSYDLGPSYPSLISHSFKAARLTSKT